jgi:hypothetical protein
VLGGEDRKFIPVKYPVALFLFSVDPLHQFSMLLLKRFKLLWKGLPGHFRIARLSLRAQRRFTGRLIRFATNGKQ